MARLKDFTVRRLRELARKHLGPGHSKLKTKEQLIAALKKIVPALSDSRSAAPARKRASAKPVKGAAAGKRAARAPRSEPAQTPRTPKAEIFRFEKPAPRERVREDVGVQLRASGMAGEGAPRIAPVEEPRAGALQDAGGIAFGRAPTTPESRSAPAAAAASPSFARAEDGPSDRGVAAEPLVEGFFVARVAGTQEARRHHLTEDQVPAPAEHGVGLHYHEQLPPIPSEYQDDRVLLLVRDPRTAFLYWGFHPDTLRAAFEGLGEPRAVLRVLETGNEVRTIDLALESRSFYVQGLRPGRRYRMELHALGSDGTSRRIGPPSNDVVLPPDDVSSDTTVRMMRVPWEIPLNRLREELRSGRITLHAPPEPPHYLELRRSRWVPSPNGGSWQLQTWAAPSGASWAMPPPSPDRGEG